MKRAVLRHRTPTTCALLHTMHKLVDCARNTRIQNRLLVVNPIRIRMPMIRPARNNRDLGISNIAQRKHMTLESVLAGRRCSKANATCVAHPSSLSSLLARVVATLAPILLLRCVLLLSSCVVLALLLCCCWSPCVCILVHAALVSFALVLVIVLFVVFLSSGSFRGWLRP